LAKALTKHALKVKNDPIMLAIMSLWPQFNGRLFKITEHRIHEKSIILLQFKSVIQQAAKVINKNKKAFKRCLFKYNFQLFARVDN